MYGFDFSRVGREIRAETLASRAGRVAAIQGNAVVTSATEFKRFDLTTMSASDVEFNTEFVLRPLDGGACAGWSRLVLPLTCGARQPFLTRLAPQQPQSNATAWSSGSTRSSARASARSARWCCPPHRTLLRRTGRRRSSTSRYAIKPR